MRPSEPASRPHRFGTADAFMLRRALQGQSTQDDLGQLTPRLVDLLCWHGVQGLVWDSWRARARAVTGAGAPRSETVSINALEAAATAVAARNALRLHEAARVVAALAERSVPVVALKGLALLVAGYAHPGLRPMEDMDFLVPEAALGPADLVLRELGYGPSVAESPDLDHHLAYRLRGEGDLPDVIEVHRRLFDAPPHDRLADSGQVIARAIPIGGRLLPAVKVPDPVDMALHVAGHAAIQHAGTERLTWIADLDRTVKRGLGEAAGPERFWDAVWARAREWDLAAALADCLAAAADWFATPVEVRSVTEAERVRYRRARSRPPVGHEGARLVYDLRLTGSWGERMTLARSAILPPREFMRLWYGVDRDWRLPAAYARRWLSGVGEVARARAGGTLAPPADWFVMEVPQR